MSVSEPRVQHSPIPAFCESLGLEYDAHWNHSPLKGMVVREVSQFDFVRGHAFDGLHGATESRQLTPEFFNVLDGSEVDYFKAVGAHAKRIQSILFFVAHGNVWGISTEWWDGKLRYWKAGCDHEFTHQTHAMFSHTATCKKCNYKVGYDSSD